MADSPKIVLLVDDEEIVRRATRRMLRDCGAEIQEARDGLEALTMLRDGLRPSIIVSDVDMPGLNGLQLAMQVKEEFPTIPIIICSGGGHNDRAAEIGVEYFEKAGDPPSRLRDLVKKAL